jgi:hypothetical protein
MACHRLSPLSYLTHLPPSKSHSQRPSPHLTCTQIHRKCGSSPTRQRLRYILNPRGSSAVEDALLMNYHWPNGSLPASGLFSNYGELLWRNFSVRVHADHCPGTMQPSSGGFGSWGSSLKALPSRFGRWKDGVTSNLTSMLPNMPRPSTSWLNPSSWTQQSTSMCYLCCRESTRHQLTVITDPPASTPNTGSTPPPSWLGPSSSALPSTGTCSRQCREKVST